MQCTVIQIIQLRMHSILLNAFYFDKETTIDLIFFYCTGPVFAFHPIIRSIVVILVVQTSIDRYTILYEATDTQLFIVFIVQSNVTDEYFMHDY